MASLETLPPQLNDGAPGTERPAVLMVSKPVAPPWNDSSKNLVKDLVRAGQHYRYRVLTHARHGFDEPGVIPELVYSAPGQHTPTLTQNLRVLARLLRRDDSALTHFFFAPNAKTAIAARLASSWRPRTTVQTVCSIPRSFKAPHRLLFADRTIVLSAHTQSRLEASGIPTEKLVHIPPGIQIPPPLSLDRRRAIRQAHGLPEDGMVVIYAGDYQFSDAAQTVAQTACRFADQDEVWFVFACRIKQAESRQQEQRIDAMLRQGGVRSRVRMLNQVPDILDLVGSADLCVLPAESLYAKMDLPLVLIEAMALQVPIVVANVAPLTELLSVESLSVESLSVASGQTPEGFAVAPADPDALARVIVELSQSPDRRATMGHAARASAIERFDIRRISAAHERLYDELLASASPTHARPTAPRRADTP